jgi:hypothetical protein
LKRQSFILPPLVFPRPCPWVRWEMPGFHLDSSCLWHERSRHPGLRSHLGPLSLRDPRQVTLPHLKKKKKELSNRRSLRSSAIPTL